MNEEKRHSTQLDSDQLQDSACYFKTEINHTFYFFKHLSAKQRGSDSNPPSSNVDLLGPLHFLTVTIISKFLNSQKDSKQTGLEGNLLNRIQIQILTLVPRLFSREATPV